MGAQRKKGDPGLPGAGRPLGSKNPPREIQLLARQHTADVLNLLVKFAKNEKNSMHDRFRACEMLLDRGWGKVPLPAGGDDEGGEGSGGRQVFITIGGDEAKY